MRIGGKNTRVRSRTKVVKWLPACLLILICACVATAIARAERQPDSSVAQSPLTVDEVVEKLVGMNLRRAQALHSYQGTRTYRVEYKGFFNAVNAEMLVEIKYLAPETKHFTVQSSTGPKLIIDRVFRKLLEAEGDALTKEGQRSAALNRENYDFKMVEYVSTPSHPMYVLTVNPKTKSKYLYQGTIWVDAKDFAVVRLKAVPAKNPSFWTKNNEIEQSYKKVNDFWLPERNHSVSFIRLGGRAELTIDYRNYQITAADPVANASEKEIARSVDSSRNLDGAESSPHQTAEAGSFSAPESRVNSHHPSTDRFAIVPEVHDTPTEKGNLQ